MSYLLLFIGYLAKYTGSLGSRFFRGISSSSAGYDSFNGGSYTLLSLSLCTERELKSILLRKLRFDLCLFLNGDYFFSPPGKNCGSSSNMLSIPLPFPDDRSISFFIAEILLDRLF